MHIDEKYLKALEDVYKMEDEFDNMFKNDTQVSGDTTTLIREESNPVVNNDPNSVLNDIQSELDDMDKIFKDINVGITVKTESNPQDNI